LLEGGIDWLDVGHSNSFLWVELHQGQQIPKVVQD